MTLYVKKGLPAAYTLSIGVQRGRKNRSVRRMYGRGRRTMWIWQTKPNTAVEQELIKRFIYSVFTKDTLDEKGQARDTSTHVTFNALNSTKNSPVAAGWNPQLLTNWIEKKRLSKRYVWPKKGLN